MVASSDIISSFPSLETQWVLTGKILAHAAVQHVSIGGFPFSIGRHSDACLSVPRETVSVRHAELIENESGLFIRDLGSRNGTFVNGQRVGSDMKVESGSLLQFGEAAFGLSQVSVSAGQTSQPTINRKICYPAQHLRKLLCNPVIIPHFQPITNLKTGEVFAFEILARFEHAGLETPDAMFRAAESVGMQVELSQMACLAGLEASWALKNVPHIFFNTHPTELTAPRITRWIEHLRALAPAQQLTLEIGGASEMRVNALRRLRRQLEELSIGLAFDDFGTGRSRIGELISIRPDYVKFDRKMIAHLDLYDARWKRFMKSLVDAVKDLGIRTLAEGIETEEEFAVCQQLGFEMAQGFYIGHPQPIRTLTKNGLNQGETATRPR